MYYENGEKSSFSRPFSFRTLFVVALRQVTMFADRGLPNLVPRHCRLVGKAGKQEAVEADG